MYRYRRICVGLTRYIHICIYIYTWAAASRVNHPCIYIYMYTFITWLQRAASRSNRRHRRPDHCCARRPDGERACGAEEGKVRCILLCTSGTRCINRGSERQSVSHPASGCLRGKDQTQEGRDPQGTDPHRGRPHRGRPTQRERPTQGARPTQETHRQG